MNTPQHATTTHRLPATVTHAAGMSVPEGEQPLVAEDAAPIVGEEVTQAEIDAEAAKAKEDAKVTNVYVLDGLVPVARLHTLEEANGFAAKLKQGQFYPSAEIIAQLLDENKIRLIRATLRVLSKAPATSADDIFQAAADAVKSHPDLKKKQPDVAVAAGLLWDELEKFDFAPASTPPVKEKKPRAEKAPKEPKDPTKRAMPKHHEHVRKHFPNVGDKKSMQELLEGTKYSEVTIRTAFSGLKSMKERHVHTGPRITIKPVEGEKGWYIRTA